MCHQEIETQPYKKRQNQRQKHKLTDGNTNLRIEYTNLQIETHNQKHKPTDRNKKLTDRETNLEKKNTNLDTETYRQTRSTVSFEFAY